MITQPIAIQRRVFVQFSFHFCSPIRNVDNCIENSREQVITIDKFLGILCHISIRRELFFLEARTIIQLHPRGVRLFSDFYRPVVWYNMYSVIINYFRHRYIICIMWTTLFPCVNLNKATSVFLCITSVVYVVVTCKESADLGRRP